MNLATSNHIWFVIKLFRLSWYQIEFRLVPKQSEKGNYNPKFSFIQQDSEKNISEKKKKEVDLFRYHDVATSPFFYGINSEYNYFFLYFIIENF